jgi:hypothetical protein
MDSDSLILTHLNHVKLLMVMSGGSMRLYAFAIEGNLWRHQEVGGKLGKTSHKTELPELGVD